MALAAIAALAAAASGYGAGRFCSPSGDYCTSAERRGGAVFLELRTFSFRGAIRICVIDPRPRQTCRGFRLRPRRAGVYEAKVRWHRHFPNGGKGLYRVRFLVGATQLGPVLTFRLR